MGYDKPDAQMLLAPSERVTVIGDQVRGGLVELEKRK